MRNQQAQEREEQQRIKNLVLSLDSRESDDPDGEAVFIQENEVSSQANLLRSANDPKPVAHHYNHKTEKPAKGQAQRGRKLQFEDFEWYEKNSAIDSTVIPGKSQGRRPPKRLEAPRQAMTDADDGEEEGSFWSRPHSRPNRFPRRSQGSRPR